MDATAGTPSDHLAVVTDYASLVAALRARADHLNISRQMIDVLGNLAQGHSAKLLSQRPVKGLGEISFGSVLFALGVQLVMMENPEAMAAIRDEFAPRDAIAVRYFDPVRKYLSQLGKAGWAARYALSPERRQQVAALAGRASGRARRRRARERNKQ
jgi:hypothetical protein